MIRVEVKPKAEPVQTEIAVRMPSVSSGIYEILVKVGGETQVGPFTGWTWRTSRAALS